MLFTEYTDNETELMDAIVCEMPDEDDDLDDDFDTAWDKENGEDPDELFNDGIETDDFSLEDEPPLEFDEEDEEDDDI
jgi:hypothetical protein